MNVLLRYLLCISIFITVSGCGDSEVEQRRLHSIDLMDYIDPSQEGERVRQLIVKALENANEISLESPYLVDVSIWAFSDGSKRGHLRISWIAAIPQADSVRISFSDGSSQVILFDDIEIAYNQEISNQHLVYNAIPFIEKTHPDVWEIILSDNDATIVLLANGEPVSNETWIYRLETRSD